MKAFYYEFFHIPKNGKIREKVLMSHVTLTAVLIIVYLLAISGSAYAFHTSATRVHNTIVAAYFDAEITISGPEGDEIELERIESEGRMLAELETPGLYEVRLEHGGTAETGFCTMQIDGEDYITAQLGVSVEEEDERRDEIKFSIQVYEPMALALESHWGTSTAYVTYSIDDMDAENYLVGGEIIEVGDPDNMWMYIEEEETVDEEETDEEEPEENEEFDDTEEAEEPEYSEESDYTD